MWQKCPVFPYCSPSPSFCTAHMKPLEARGEGSKEASTTLSSPQAFNQPQHCRGAVGYSYDTKE